MHETRKEQVIEAAIHLFRTKGYHATSVQDIADAVGLRKGSLYHYITSKEELLFDIIHETIQVYIRRLEAIAARPEPAAQRLARAITAHIEAVAQETEGFAIFIGETRALEPGPRRRIEEASQRYRHLLQQLIEEAAQEGAFRPTDSTLASLAILGACNWMHRWYDPQGRLRPQEIAQQFTEIFFHGLVHPPAGPAPAGRAPVAGTVPAEGRRPPSPEPSTPQRGALAPRALKEVFFPWPISTRIMHELRQKLETHPERWQELELACQLELSGEGGGTYHLVLKGGQADIGPGALDEPQLTLAMAADAFERLVAGQLNPTAAFMSGQLKIQGDIGMALKLQALLR